MPKSKDVGHKAVREQLFTLMRSAHEGKPGLEWFGQLAARAGYVRVEGGAGEGLALASFQGLAVGLGISERALRKLIAEGLPVYRQGLGNQPSVFNVFAVVKWIRDRDERAGGSRQKSKVVEEELLVEQLKKERRLNDRAEGKLIERSSVVEGFSRICSPLKNHLEMLQSKVPKPVVDEILEVLGLVNREFEKTFGGQVAG